MVTGNPIRTELLKGDREEAKNFFKLSGTKPVILILGGSQGAQRINDKILAILSQLLESFELIHQCGEKNYESVKNEAKVVIKPDQQGFYHPLPFLKEPELRNAYTAGDLIISRSGSGSIFEIAAAGKPCILIPSPNVAEDHQTKNAMALVTYNAALLLKDAEARESLCGDAMKLINDPEQCHKLSENISRMAFQDSAKVIANEVLSLIINRKGK